jgi:predicted phosphodiesterase
MQVAALFDIHGNLPALEAVLDEVDQIGVDVILLGGDIVLGPLPRETLDRLSVYGDRMQAVLGNCEREVVEAYDGGGLEGVPEPFRDDVRWVSGQLDRAQRDWLDELPLTRSLEIVGLGPVLFCHATPRDENEIFTAISPEARVLSMLAGTMERTVVCGHTHMQFDRNVGPYRVVNSGSVGMSYGRPGACWALLGPDVRLVNTPYDVERAAERIRRSGHPQAERFVTEHVLRTPEAEDVLAVFERASTRAAGAT